MTEEFNRIKVSVTKLRCEHKKQCDRRNKKNKKYCSVKLG